MQKVSLPPLRNGIHVSSVSQREPPSRSWTKYKKLLIDNPRDANLLQRQKLWNFQKLNRGAFRSHLDSLPDIPYRVHTVAEKVSVGVQTEPELRRVSTGLRVIFPNLTSRRPSIFSASVDSDDDNNDNESVSSTRNKACSPMNGCDEEYPDDFEEASSVEDPGFDFDTVLKRKNASTMTEPRAKKKEKKKKSVIARNKELDSILRADGAQSVRKSVKFQQVETADASSQTPDIPTKTPTPLPDIDTAPIIEKLDLSKLGGSGDALPLQLTTRRELSVLSTASRSSFVELPVGSIGHSSHVTKDPVVSVLDFLSGGMSERHRNSQRSQRKRNARACVSTDPEADRVWFEKIVGDQEVIDSGAYESFARTRPNLPENTSDSNADRYNDFTKAYAARKNFTPRVNDEFPQYHSLLAREKKFYNTGVNTKQKAPKRQLVNVGKLY